MSRGVERTRRVRIAHGSWVAGAWLASAVTMMLACNERALDSKRMDAGPPAAGGLTPEQASRVVAKIGNRVITLGDYAATLERMDLFDRLRYQSAERRKELLDEIIDAELLAEDARRKKLGEQTETQQAIRQVLREAVLSEAKKGMMAPADIPPAEIAAYYEAHRDDFREPERRRVAHILLKDNETATKVIALSRKAGQREWGELFQKYSLDAPKKPGEPAPPLELSGDLGIVGPPLDPRGDNPRVDPAVRAAVFELQSIGEVLGRPVETERGFHVVRLVGKSDARERSLADADRSIRVTLLQAKIAEREKMLEADLRKQYPVTVDEQALANVRIPVAEPERDASAPSLPPKSTGRGAGRP